MKTKKQLLIKYGITAIVFCAIFIVASAIKVKAGTTDNTTGWLWGGGAESDGSAPWDGTNTNVGWISMNSTNCDMDKNGFIDSGDCGGNNSTTAVVNYGVKIPDVNGNLSGYAWSSNLGWISFQETSGFPTVTSGDDYAYQPKRVGNELRGWARIMSIPQAGTNAGNWFGWIRLHSDQNDPKQYGILLNADGTITKGQTTSYGWSDELGWIDFSGSHIATATATDCGTATDLFNPTITYSTVIAKDNNCWLDRNLGATEVATSATDYLSYGSLFQWGRAADGHQLINWTSATTGAGVYGVFTPIATLATSDNPGHNLFITSVNAPSDNSGPQVGDWRNPQNNNLWQDDGINKNNPCPTGFRLPTSNEWSTLKSAESITNAATAYSSTLKLPLAGVRHKHVSGSIIQAGTAGEYYSSSINSTNVNYFSFNSTSAAITLGPRADGLSVRCIKGSALTYKLNVNAGSGIEVTSSDGFIDCKDGSPINSGACYHDYAIGTPPITLTETTDAAYDFAGWSGACSGLGETCTVTMDADKTVTTNATLKCFCDLAANRCPGNKDDSCGNHNACPDGTKTTGCGGGGLAPRIWKEVAP